MRLHRLRFDIWLCLLVAYPVSLGTGAAASALSAATYDGYAEVHSAAPGQAGSPSGRTASPVTADRGAPGAGCFHSVRPR